MKVLIAYDSVSPNKNTEKVAEAIRDVLKTKGMDVQSSYVKDVVPSSVESDGSHKRIPQQSHSTECLGKAGCCF